MSYASNTTLNVQVWLGAFPWRPTSAWAVLAAMLSTGLLARPFELNWQTLALVLVLVDLLWGGIWRLAAGRQALLPLHEQVIQQQVWLPYLQPRSPAYKLLGWDNTGVLPLLFRVVLPSVVLALALASVLGVTAVWMTGLLMLVSVLGWTIRRSLEAQPVLLQSIATIGLPWLLASQLLPTVQGAGWPLSQTGMILLWVLHNWGEGRLLCAYDDRFGLVLLAGAEVGMVLLLIFLQAPLWLGLLVILWLPAWLLIYQRQPLQRVTIWWLGALLISALALGQVNR
jgi:hypothetical protein